MIVVYSSHDEVIVTNVEDEVHMLHDYFFEKSGRELEEYHRSVYSEPFTIKSELKVS